MPRSIDLQPTANVSVNREWSFTECLRVLYEHKLVVLSVTALAILATIFISLWQHRVYQSRATLEIQPFNDNYLSLGGVYGAVPSNVDTATYMQTQAEILQQDAVLEKVARELRLAQLLEFQGPGGVLARLRKDISIVPLRNTRVLQIICNARSPQLAADLANTLGSTFIEENIRARQQAARETYESLLPALASLGRRFRQAPDVEASRSFYETVRDRANNAWVASMVRQSNIRWVSAAQPPTRPYKPNLPLNLAIGTVGGFLLAVAGVLLREQNSSVLREPGEAGLYLTLPELGAIPRATPKKGLARGLVNGSGGGNYDDGLECTSALLESFRATAASILSTRRDGSHSRVFVVTSPHPTEGKTTVVSNLGIALAEIGSRVLLIDGDLRRPRLHQVFDQANSWGLSDVLREQNAIDALPLDVLTKKTAVPRLYVLPSGAYTDNIFGLLHSGRLSTLLPRFREAFDYVLVDAPPCLEFADARVMAQYAEQLVLVVRANYTDRRAALAAVQRLRLDGLRVMGVILNHCEPDSVVYRNSTFRGSTQGVS
jgi:receptor protein-tyrosine kinase